MSRPLSIPITMDLSWRYASGAPLARFCAGLAERRIQALACDGCGRRYLPPRPVCGRCNLRLIRWVDVADEGTIVALSVVHVPILDARTGTPRPVPYSMALVLLDGADTTLNHLLGVTDPEALAIGLRVRAVWREELIGSIDDIRCFEVLG